VGWSWLRDWLWGPPTSTPQRPGGDTQARRKSQTQRAAPDVHGTVASDHAAKNYAVCLVIPAREFELINELRSQQPAASPAPSPIDQRLAQHLKTTAQGLWYGATDAPAFHDFARLAQETQQQSFNSSLDLVVCLFELRGRNPALEAGTIGQRYDGILALADKVRAMHISPQVSPDALRGLPLTTI
jgi:hypothetical protein